MVVPFKYKVDEGRSFMVLHRRMMDCISASNNVGCIPKWFCDGFLGGHNLQLDKSDHLFLSCALEEQQHNLAIGLFDESLVVFAG